MSYILDALRKAERERNLGQPPSLHSVTQPAALTRPSHRRLWPLLAVITLSLLLAIATLVWKRHRAAQPAAPVAVAPAPAALPAAPVAEPEAAGSASSLDDLAPVQTPDTSMADEPAEEVAQAPAATASRPTVVREAPLAEAEEEMPEAEEAAADSIALVKDMPAGYRSAFAALTIEVHVYDDNPAKRWIMANSRRYREGEALSEGPRIAEITPDGIVFEHQGQQALYPIAR